jgi:hypothetical protein
MDWVSEGTGYQNVQKKSIPKTFVKKLRSGIHVVGCATTKEDGGQFHYPL